MSVENLLERILDYRVRVPAWCFAEPITSPHKADRQRTALSARLCLRGLFASASLYAPRGAWTHPCTCVPKCVEESSAAVSRHSRLRVGRGIEQTARCVWLVYLRFRKRLRRKDADRDVGVRRNVCNAGGIRERYSQGIYSRSLGSDGNRAVSFRLSLFARLALGAALGRHRYVARQDGKHLANETDTVS